MPRESLFNNDLTMCNYKRVSTFRRATFEPYVQLLWSGRRTFVAAAILIYILYISKTFSGFYCQSKEVNSYLPTIYAITPTRKRLEQEADLTRLLQTLMHVNNLHWIVVEDSYIKTDIVTNLLKNSDLKYTHLNIRTRKRRGARGVEQRNRGLDWVRSHLMVAPDKRGVVYFMDDDNTYSLKLFGEMRKVHRVGTWPVGLAGGLRYEAPLVNINGTITGFNAIIKRIRPFPIDMAGFAINATLFLQHREARFSRDVPVAFQESEILKYFTTPQEMEPLADLCSKVYVWHTRTERTEMLRNPRRRRTAPPPMTLLISALANGSILEINQSP